MSIETHTELEGLRAAGHAVATTLRAMQAHARPGMSTKELDEYGYELLQSFGANSAPQQDYNFPGYTCISINDEVCHGIPSNKKILREGDLVNIDVSAEVDGYYGDNGSSFVLGEDLHRLEPLVQASREILSLVIQRVKTKVKIADLGGFIEKEARKRGYAVIKNLCGHGIGRRLHEPPREIPNFRDRYNHERLQKNAVIALETFISSGDKFVYLDPDGWTMRTKRRALVAQHEHTLIVTDGEPVILTGENGVSEW